MSTLNNNLAKHIDHTVLKPTTTQADVGRVCDEALQYQFAAVCVPPHYVKQAAERLKGSKVGVATVVGFPMGYNHYLHKWFEITKAVRDGANELDTVVNIAAVKNGEWGYIRQELKTVADYCRQQNATSKIIIESGLLTKQEIVSLCNACASAGVDYVKTSTGYAGEGKGASAEVVALMRANLPDSVKIKASGGIRTAEFAQSLLDAGAQRLGCSNGVAIVTQSKPPQPQS